ITQPPRSTLFPYTTLFRSQGRTKAIRRTAGKCIVANSPVSADERSTRRERNHPDDAEWSARLVAEHGRLNAEHFATALSPIVVRSEEHTSELQSRSDLVCR